MAERRRTYVPTLLLGVGSAGLGVLAASNPWVRGSSGTVTGESLAQMGTDVTRSPLASALCFVVLACWGVVLVTRGWFRRTVMVLAVAASLGFAAVVAIEPRRMLDGLAQELLQGHGATDVAETDPTGWVIVAAVAALLMVSTTVAGLFFLREWPEMGSRYDSPAQSRRGDSTEGNLDMWKALDEGRDPTA